MCQKPEKRGSLPLGSGPPISGPELGTVLFVIESFRLGEIGLRVFHELGPSVLVAEAIGLPLVIVLTKQFVETFLCDARPIVHILPNSPFVAATAAVASPRTKAPAIADVTYDLIIVSSFQLRNGPGQMPGADAGGRRPGSQQPGARTRVPASDRAGFAWRRVRIMQRG